MPKLDTATAARVPSGYREDYDLPDISNRGDKHHVSYSELATFRDCPLKWQIRYLYRLVPPERQARLDRGSAWHAMLEAHYNGIAAEATKSEALGIVLDAMNHYAATVPAGLPTEEFETLRWMYDDYVRIYGSDPQYTTIATETEFEFPLPVPSHPGLLIVGKIDHETLDTNDGETRRVWDHKSASGRDVSKDGFLTEMLMEDQYVLYAAAYREQGKRVASVVHNVARTDRLKRAMLDTERFSRVSIPYPDAALDDILRDNTAAAEQLIRMWNDPEQVYSVPNARQCGWKCEWQRSHIESRNTGRHIVRVALGYGATLKPTDETDAAVEPEDSVTGGW